MAFSHVRLHLQGWRPNPGLGSTPLYVVEALAVAFLYSPAITLHWGAALIWAALAAGLFLAVIPFFRLIARAAAGWRQPKWNAGEALPAAARP